MKSHLCISIAVSPLAQLKMVDYGLLTILSSDVKRHATLNPSLGVIEKERIPIERGADNELYYVVRYEIHAVYYSAHCVYTLWYEGRNYGSVKADYV